MADTKRCVVCENELPVTEYWKKGKNRLDTNCKKCRKVKNDAYRAANKDKIRAKAREWDQNHREMISEARLRRLSSMTDQQKAVHKAKYDKYRRDMAQRRIEQYLEQHGSTPLCACGCGNNVGFTEKGVVNTYVNNHHPRNNRYTTTSFNPDTHVPIGKFREVMHSIKKKKQFTNKQMAEKAGLAITHFESLMYDKSKAKNLGLDKKFVENILRRLHDLPAPPTPYMLRNKPSIDHRYQSTDPRNYR